MLSDNLPNRLQNGFDIHSLIFPVLSSRNCGSLIESSQRLGKESPKIIQQLILTHDEGTCILGYLDSELVILQKVLQVAEIKCFNVSAIREQRLA